MYLPVKPLGIGGLLLIGIVLGTRLVGADGSSAGDKPLAGRQFWSLQPVKQPVLPAVKRTDWAQGPIDQFILAKLKEKGLTPAPGADKRTLLRRLTYDLTGLPPTSQEMEGFLADERPEAYAKAVDRLLASPRYGEHWGRHWLDLARYADTRWVGAAEDRRMPFAYTYRDWVIGALNRDVPYDRFVTLQLAADQLPSGGDPADQAALGFLTVGRWFTGNIHEIIDDQIDVVTRGLLGLTVQCARCHNHKYDPVSTKDYYSLYGLFAASRMPFDGTGTVALLPEITGRPVESAREHELAAKRDQLDKYLLDRQNAVRAEFGTPEKMAEYLQSAQRLVNKTDKDIKDFAKTYGQSEGILFRWVRLLKRNSKEQQAIFGAWQALAALAEDEFAAKLAETVQHEKAKKINPHVAAILDPLPQSVADLADRYARLLIKFDREQQSANADEEAIRQILRGNESPVQVPFGDLGQFLTQDQKDHIVGTRRALLQELNKLPESADQFLNYQREAAPLIEEVTSFLERRREALTAELQSSQKIADYLLAAHEAREADDSRIRAIARNRKLNDRLVRRWVTFLRQCADQDDAVFAAWRAFVKLEDQSFAGQAREVASAVEAGARNRLISEAFESPPASLSDVAARYGQLLNRCGVSGPSADAAQEAIRRQWTSPDSPAATAREDIVDVLSQKERDDLRGKEARLLRLYIDHPGAAPRAMAFREFAHGYEQKVFVRGNPNVLGADAPGKFLSVLSTDDRAPFQKGKGRLQLAHAIVDPANPLTARVLVNRVWQQHFGAGLVNTPSDFGVRGDPPSHPELLDWLAAQFVADGWSLKKLHRRILLSATYQQSSADNQAARAADPENRLLWRMSRRRLSFEELRDSLLGAGGHLDLVEGGRPVDLTRFDARRRTVYGFIDRVKLPSLFRSFDFPGADAHTSGRQETLVPQQALYLMNNSFVMNQAYDLTRRPEVLRESTAEGRVAALYRLVYNRPPTAEELALGSRFAGPIDAPEDDASPWAYGYGRYREGQGVVNFEPLPFFVNGSWRGAQQDHDPVLGHSNLNARGGFAGNDRSVSMIRRWIAPQDGKVSIAAKFDAQANSLAPQGDCVRGRIVSSRHGVLGCWIVCGTEEQTDIPTFEVRRGDIVDFVVEGRGRESNHGWFNWAPILRLEDSKQTWDAAKDFSGKNGIPKRYTAWDRYAQVLLEANEFLFID